MTTIRIPTLNINRMASVTRITMLAEFLRTWEIDILLAQEVTQPVLHKITGYITQYNIGTSRRGMAIVARDGINLANVIRLPSGRAIAARFRDLWLINIYAPTGTAWRQERETFYASELPLVLTDTAHHTVMGGDFNCILEKGDASVTLNYSRALANLAGGMNLQDAWQRSADQCTRITRSLGQHGLTAYIPRET
jgi:exonuclease III